MKALLKDQKTWVDIETDYLFNNQYNTVDGRRIFDQDIARIVDDARAGMGKCRYCGKMIRRGEEEKHFEEREKAGCVKCYWNRQRVTESKTDTETRTDEDGTRTTIKTTVEKLTPVCTFGESAGCNNKTGCTLTECRAYGVEWFTPENTFFLRYPNGAESISDVDKLSARGFIVEDSRVDAAYCKKIGSYNLEAVLSYKDGKPDGIKYFHIWNCRRSYNFFYRDGILFTDKYSFGWRQVKTLDGVLPSVMAAVRNICNM